jgi:bis(5'-adenosyl)-triphosphatase
VCPKINDLTPDEMQDLFALVHKVTPVIESYYNASASNIGVQNGAASGQSVPHVHVHILPRREGDFERVDEVHEKLDVYNVEESVNFNKVRIARSLEDMAAERNILRSLMENSKNDSNL